MTPSIPLQQKWQAPFSCPTIWLSPILDPHISLLSVFLYSVDTMDYNIYTNYREFMPF